MSTTVEFLRNGISYACLWIIGKINTKKDRCLANRLLALAEDYGVDRESRHRSGPQINRIASKEHDMNGLTITPFCHHIVNCTQNDPVPVDKIVCTVRTKDYETVCSFSVDRNDTTWTVTALSETSAHLRDAAWALLVKAILDHIEKFGTNPAVW